MKTTRHFSFHSFHLSAQHALTLIDSLNAIPIIAIAIWNDNESRNSFTFFIFMEIQRFFSSDENINVITWCMYASNGFEMNDG